jgi:hypothetical protein
MVYHCLLPVWKERRGKLPNTADTARHTLLGWGWQRIERAGEHLPREAEQVQPVDLILREEAAAPAALPLLVLRALGAHPPAQGRAGRVLGGDVAVPVPLLVPLQLLVLFHPRVVALPLRPGKVDRLQIGDLVERHARALPLVQELLFHALLVHPLIR